MTVASRTVPVMPGRAVTPAKRWTREPVATSAHMQSAATTAKGSTATIRSYRFIGFPACGESDRSIQPAKRTQTAVAAVIMLRLCRR